MSSPVFITNLVIYTGTDFAQTFVLEDYRSNTTMDLTGYTGRGHIKKYASESYAAEFSFYLALDPKTGRFSIEMLSAATSKLKPGSYRMYAIPDSQSWEVVLNSEAGTFGFNPPDKQNDILSVIVPVQEINESLEQFTIDFNKDTLGINLIMSWDKTRVIVPIKPN